MSIRRYRRNMTPNGSGVPSRSQTRTALVEVAARLLHEQGVAAVTTRAVAQAAGVQAPTIYRLFEDKDGLLEAVAQHALAAYVAGKEFTEDDGDPVADLRSGWDTHVGFGLANPALFGLLIDPSRVSGSRAAAAGLDILTTRVRRVAAAGRLRVPERRAVRLLQAAGTGAVLTVLSMPPEDRGLDLTDAMYETVTHAILTDQPPWNGASTTAAAVTFRTVVPELSALSPIERALLTEWLDRAADS